MHDRLSVEVTLRRFMAWRVAIALLTALAAASWVAWVLSRASWPLAWQIAAMAGGSASVALLGRSLMAMRAGVLACRGGRWSFVAGAPLPLEPGAASEVELAVALDLGGFFLFRLQPLGASRRPAFWLAAERRGLEDRWQALRCAVYAPRAAGSAGAAIAE